MAKNLVIVESPSKSKTIGKYLGNDYKVMSSVGHIRDLATTGKYGFGVDVDNGFKPSYVTMKGKNNVIKELKKNVKDSDMVFLASDPDREGEAIAWHLKDTLGLKDNYKRVLFNEITKDKVIEAINNPTVIDDNLVKSQETRRILDRIIGFRLSKLLQNKIGAKSAGRVQSVALKLIVDRERERNEFIPEEYWTITAIFKDFEAELFKYKNDDIELKNEDEVNKVLDKLDKKYIVESVEKKEKKLGSKIYPFTTSTLQQTASNKLGFSAKKTMSTAQKLYEGVDLGKETTGLITYMRTDSIRLSDDFVKPTMKFIEEEYGKKYVGYVKNLKKKDNVQDAHEGIRPTSILRTPESIKNYLTKEEYKLYNLIYKRTLASLMADAIVDATTMILDNNDYKFKSTGQVLIFDGYKKVYGEFEDSKDKILPELGKAMECISVDTPKSEQHFTSPPARYTEASLIKKLEEDGIGRPSTYASIIDTIKSRGYVNLEDKKFVPTEIGIETTDKLQEFFSDIINVDYTSNMELDLDKIAEGKEIWNEVLQTFYDFFEPRVKDAFTDMEKKEPVETGETCPECGNPLVIRKGRYGEFTACSNYPECKYIKKEEVKVVEVCPCPNCSGTIVEKTTRKGKTFYGCNKYPKCKTAYWDLPIGEKCPVCENMLVEKKDGTVSCSECDYKK